MQPMDSIQYGTCPCGGSYERRSREVTMTVDGKRQDLSQVPQGACPNCDARVYKVEVLERVEATMRGEPVDPRSNRQQP